jgi:hypothetical protein
MPNKIDPEDFLYRLVRPKQHKDGRLLTDAYDDQYPKQSFMVASICTPRQILEKFAQYSGARKRCNKHEGDPDPSCEEMYNADYRVAVTSVEVIRTNLDLEFVLEPDGSECRDDGHVNVKDARLKAELLIDPANSRLLTQEETLGV